MKDDSHILSRERIIVTDTLLIDEISMISSKSLLDVEFILRKIRNNDRPFGGMQVNIFKSNLIIFFVGVGLAKIKFPVLGICLSCTVQLKQMPVTVRCV